MKILKVKWILKMISISLLISFSSSCTIALPIFHTAGIKFEDKYENQIEYYDGYETKETQYETTEMKWITKKVKKQVKIPPIIKRNNVILAFTRFAGANEPKLEQISEAIKIGFQEEKKNSEKRVKFISRGQLLRKLGRSELNDMGEKIENKLKRYFGVNAICTGTLLSDGKLSIEVIDLKTEKNYTAVFSGSYREIGREVAKAFFGTRIKIKYIDRKVYEKVPVTKTKTELVPARKSRYKKVLITKEEQKQEVINSSMGAGFIIDIGLIIATAFYFISKNK